MTFMHTGNLPQMLWKDDVIAGKFIDRLSLLSFKGLAFGFACTLIFSFCLFLIFFIVFITYNVSTRD